MNKLDKYIISNYVKSFLLGMMMFFLIFLLAESISLTGWIMDGKLKGHDAIKYLRYGTPEIITNTAPLGVLLGSLLCISKMAKQLEIAAMKTSGISFARIALFPMIFSFLVSMGVFWINYDILGKSNTKKENLKSLKIDNKEPVRAQKKFVFVKIDKKTVLYSENVNKNTGTMEYIEIFKFEKGFSKISKIYTSPFAKINTKTNVWTFKDLKEYDSRTNLTKPADTKKFRFVASMEDVLASPVKAKNLTMPELREKTVYFTRVGADSLNLRIEFYYRISFALSSFVMCLIGLSLGSRYVRGGAALNIGLSVIIGYAYYGISTILRSMAVAGTVPIYAACFIPLIVFFVVGIKLFRDSEY
ncbi:LptF/LptG family permease [Leptotrichia wadei]|uniref:LptF/LptG family permease n=1 Tax=Leptotrichia wadei TaxID=157687 RepID=UPI0028EDDC02|nr:LptF/LptG family permease [Leptotrichia wadei]